MWDVQFVYMWLVCLQYRYGDVCACVYTWGYDYELSLPSKLKSPEMMQESVDLVKVI